jgi:cell division protein FtsB
MAIDTTPRTPVTPRIPADLRTPVIPRTRPVTAPRHARPVTGPGTRPGRRSGARPASRRARSPRMPFVLLLVGLLGGALVSLLVISTTLAQGSFQITSLQEQNASLARQEQTLTSEVAQAANPAVIAKKARQFGMRPNPHLGFIDLKTGKVVVGNPSAAEAAISVTGYSP